MSTVQAKYLKDENNQIISPITAFKSVIINETNLYEYIKNKEEIPIGTKLIYSSQSGLSFGHNSWVNISNYIYTGFTMPNINKTPVLPGFKRYVRMRAVFSDNVNGSIYPNRGMVIAAWDNSNNYDLEWSFSPIWGSLDDRTEAISREERPYDDLTKSHLNFKVIIAGEVNSDALGKLYHLQIEYLDRLEE